ncbi:MAG: DUF4845 domain-containing protein [Gammaproteobacteria bacterium]|nr:DUF4845 domain-containing protein [Gammaproteobacteria bacterium]
MKLKQNQAGMTAIGWLIVIAIFGFFVLLVLRMLPVYLEWFTVEKAMEIVKQDPEVGSWTKDQIVSRLDKHFTINQVTRVNLKEHLKIERDEKTDGRTITIKYDVAAHVAGNVDVLMHFNKTVALPPPR